METFKEFIDYQGRISSEKLDELFAGLEAVEIKEMTGHWRGGFFSTGNRMEILLKGFPFFKWYGKNFLSQNNVQALIFSFFGIKFNIPFGTAVLRKTEFRNKISTAMIYNYLPIIDNFRKVDEDTVFGIMEIKGKIGVYFYLERAGD